MTVRMYVCTCFQFTHAVMRRCPCTAVKYIYVQLSHPHVSATAAERAHKPKDLLLYVIVLFVSHGRQYRVREQQRYAVHIITYKSHVSCNRE
jgi:hypothetical protein